VEGKIVTVKLNQQQLQLIDRTIALGLAPDRASLMRLALREYAGQSASAAEPSK
jgi:Arc/MetJ-type ribon-helix-helix transcriptional regulator